MRNGNNLQDTLNLFHLLRSYPTYEEWKQPAMNGSSKAFQTCSYPTYEEWKPM